MALEVMAPIMEVPVGTWEVPVGTWEVADAMGQSVDRASANTPAKHQTDCTWNLRLQEIGSNVPLSPFSKETQHLYFKSKLRTAQHP